jgi:crotonobetainyl-CoA hydratase
MAIRASKEVVLKGLGLELPDAIGGQFDFPGVTAMWQSADAQEGPTAFVQKRKPQWRGC